VHRLALPASFAPLLGYLVSALDPCIDELDVNMHMVPNMLFLGGQRLVGLGGRVHRRNVVWMTSCCDAIVEVNPVGSA
jgi:hypothetical protein